MPADFTLIGNKCVNLTIAPVFGNRGGRNQGAGRGGRGGRGGLQQRGGGGQQGATGGGNRGGAGGQKGSTGGQGGGKKSGAGGGGAPKATTQQSGSGSKRKPAGTKSDGKKASDKKASETDKSGTQGADKCPNNMVKLANGLCSCPPDLPQQIGSKCFKSVPGAEIKRDPSKDCKGGIRTNKGKCVCPKDRPKLVNGTCTGDEKPAQTQQQQQTTDPADCGDGRRREPTTGRCLCPSRLSFISGSCVRATPGRIENGQVVCPPGQTIRPGSRDRGGAGTCVPDEKAQQERKAIEDRKKEDLKNKKEAEERRKAQEIKDNKAREEYLKKKAAEDAAKAKNDPNDCGDGRKDNPTGRCLCPAGLSFISGSCVSATPGRIQNGQVVCPPGQTIRPGSRDRGGPGTCVPDAKAQQERTAIEQRNKEAQKQREKEAKEKAAQEKAIRRT